MTTMLCTAGASVAGNVRWSGDDNAYRNAIGERLKGIAPERFDRESCAELNSLHRMPLDGERDRVILLHSDTADGKICAEEVGRIVRQRLKVSAEVRRIEGLQTLDAQRFRAFGIPALLRTLWEYVGSDKDVYLNITGGFKSVVPYMTLFGLVHRLPVIYVFERSDDLIELPPFPINLDLDRLALVRPALDRLGCGQARTMEAFRNILPVDEADDDWYRALVEEDQAGQMRLSALGQMFVVARKQTVLVRRQVIERVEELARSDRSAAARCNALLARAGDPMWRASHVHTYHSTDLTVLKRPFSSERIAGFRKDASFCVAELYLDHDEYDRHLRGKRKEDYRDAQFVEFEAREAAEPAAAAYRAEQMPGYDELLAEIQRLEQAPQGQARELGTLRNRVTELRTNVGSLQQTLQARNLEIRALTRECAALRAERDRLLKELADCRRAFAENKSARPDA